MPDESRRLEPTSMQRRAIEARGKDVFVTAGAGSGKTFTLVERYLGLLEEGMDPREILAITFTRRAAREMRNRVRTRVGQRAELARAGDSAEADRWADLEARMDAARIGTIHSICQEILAMHPAEAGLDPGIGVIEEGRAAAKKAEEVEATLEWAVGQADLASLFDLFNVRTLRRFCLDILQSRHQDWSRLQSGSSGVDDRLARSLRGAILACLAEGDWHAHLADLRAIRDAGGLESDAGALLAEKVQELLAAWEQVSDQLAGLEESEVAGSDEVPVAGLTPAADQAPRAGSLPQSPLQTDTRMTTLLDAAAGLRAMRTGPLAGTAGKGSSEAKVAVAALRAIFDDRLKWLKGRSSQTGPPLAEQHLRHVQWPLAALAEAAVGRYEHALRLERLLDFDDLEALAVSLLERPEVAGYWQGRLRAVIVDEFQDTNDTQRRIVDRLSGGGAGTLFVVGDARQSIYRFRGADVGVFLGLQRAIESRGGEVVELDITYRAHEELLGAVNGLLSQVMRTEAVPGQSWSVPFTPLRSHPSVSAPAGIQAPYVEFVIGQGDDAPAGRAAAAAALADRLGQLHDREGFAWGEMALLFRASTGFPAYETALAARGIPFVTVAGRGFYDRPEIRDVLNLLAALADPTDDLAMAGFLRSPVVGLSDAGLYQLRWSGGQAPVPFRTALAKLAAVGHDASPRSQRSLFDEPMVRWGVTLEPTLEPALEPTPPAWTRLGAGDAEAASRAFDLMTSLSPLVDRLTVAELLKRLLDATDYGAVMAGVSERSARNLEKLLADAHASGLTQVRAYLHYIRSLRDVGVREGEAPEAASGAVQLMTIHKAKGLEYPLVVLADASSAPHGNAPTMRISEEGALAGHLDRVVDGTSLLKCYLDGQAGVREAAETERLLYVAVTRAQHKLVINGYVKPDAPAGKAGGWLGGLLAASGADLTAARLAPGVMQPCAGTSAGCAVGLWGEVDGADAKSDGLDQASVDVARAEERIEIGPSTASEDPVTSAISADRPKSLYKPLLTLS